jgi:hypothetical protein
MPFDEAVNGLTFADSKNILEMAEKYARTKRNAIYVSYDPAGGSLTLNSSKLRIPCHGDSLTMKSGEQSARLLYQYGYSTLLVDYPGCGVAVEMADRGFASKLVLMAPLTSSIDIALGYFPIKLSVDLTVQDKMDDLAKAHRSTVPVMILHGRDVQSGTGIGESEGR